MSVRCQSLLAAAITAGSIVQAQEFPQATVALEAVEACERRTRFGDCSVEARGWAEALGESIGADSGRVTEICSMPLTQAAIGRCKAPENVMLFGIDMGEVMTSVRDCVNRRSSYRECHDVAVQRYGAILEKHGSRLPVPMEGHFQGPLEESATAQIIADVVRLYGHACSSVTSFSIGERRIVCNHGRYTYSVGNRGGVVAVAVE